MRRNIARWTPSPNYRKFKKERIITLVVIHATATKGIDSPLEWLCNKASKVSAHYIIGKDGAAHQLVDENDIAWHAGVSEWEGQANVNEFSIGIELVNSNDGLDKYPDIQLDKCAYITSRICIDHEIPIQHVVGHADVAPGRKTDPAGFDWEDFRMRLADYHVRSEKMVKDGHI